MWGGAESAMVRDRFHGMCPRLVVDPRNLVPGIAKNLAREARHSLEQVRATVLDERRAANEEAFSRAPESTRRLSWCRRPGDFWRRG